MCGKELSFDDKFLIREISLTGIIRIFYKRHGYGKEGLA
jgi:hypothetical protein